MNAAYKGDIIGVNDTNLCICSRHLHVAIGLKWHRHWHLLQMCLISRRTKTINCDQPYWHQRLYLFETCFFILGRTKTWICNRKNWHRLICIFSHFFLLQEEQKIWICDWAKWHRLVCICSRPSQVSFSRKNKNMG